jgi:outer membrane protein insertion porin family
MKCKASPALAALSLFLFSIIVGSLSFGVSTHAQETPGKVVLTDVKISGNVRVEDEGIRLHLKNRAGATYDPAVVEQDVKAIFRMGFFDDVRAELSADGVLTYTVKEKPYVREVKIQGNSQVAKEKIDTALGIVPRSVLDRGKVIEGVEKVRKLYSDQGYVNARVDYAVTTEANNQAVVVIDVAEGARQLIKRISFEGNKTFSEGELKDLMATKEESILSVFTNRGVLDRDVLTNDMAILSNHYLDHGYIDQKFDDPVVLRARDGLEIVVRVNEGDQYRIGKVELGGDFIEDGKATLKRVKITSGQIFRGSRLREDITSLTELYTNKGFAFAQVEPVTKVNAQEKNVDIALVVTKGPPVYFNRILVAGNSKTRDNVVRRELVTTEQELFSSGKVTQSRNALQRTGYFEDVQLTTKKTDQPDTVDLHVDVKEGSTGTFSVGAGYSSGDGFIFSASVAEKNFFGRGQNVSGNFAIGSTRQDFVFSFNEPYFNETRTALGFDAYNIEREYNAFDERRLGFGVSTSYPLQYASLPFFGRKSPALGSDELPENGAPTIWHFMRAGVSYDLTRETINDIDPGASQEIKNEEGTSLTSAVTPGLTYDSRDHFFNPTEGAKSAFSVKTAGLGGDNRFIKADLTGRWHYPLLKDPNWGGAYVLALGGGLGYGVGFTKTGSSESDLPLFERYFLGGMNSVRGFAERSIGPKSKSCVTEFAADGTCNNEEDVIGGDKSAFLNVELLFPIMEQYGLRGVAFFDMGNSFNGSNFSLSDFRRSVGIGGRWMSPFGPLRVELGFPISKQPGDDTSVIGFSIGQ